MILSPILVRLFAFLGKITTSRWLPDRMRPYSSVRFCNSVRDVEKVSTLDVSMKAARSWAARHAFVPRLRPIRSGAIIVRHGAVRKRTQGSSNGTGGFVSIALRKTGWQVAADSSLRARPGVTVGMDVCYAGHSLIAPASRVKWRGVVRRFVEHICVCHLWSLLPEH